MLSEPEVSSPELVDSPLEELDVDVPLELLVVPDVLATPDEPSSFAVVASSPHASSRPSAALPNRRNPMRRRYPNPSRGSRNLTHIRQRVATSAPSLPACSRNDPPGSTIVS